MGVGAQTKGYIKNKSTGEVKYFLFNPSGYEDSRGVEFSEISSPGSSYPRFQYVKTGARTMSLELFLTNTKKGTVASHLTFLEKFLPKGARFSKPPVLIFAMGSDVRECIVTNVDRQFLEFDTNLNPTKVTVNLSLTLLG